MNKEFLYMQKLAGIITEGEYREKIDEAAAEDLELKSFAKKLYSYAKKNGAQASYTDFSNRSIDQKISDPSNIKQLGKNIKDTSKPYVDINIYQGGEAVVRMVGSGVEQLYKDIVQSFPKADFFKYQYSDTTPFPPYEKKVPFVSFNVKSKTTGKKGGVAATESLKSKIKNVIKEVLGEGANTDLEIKSMAKDMFSVLKKYKLRPKYDTGTINFDSKQQSLGYGGVVQVKEDKGGTILTVALYYLGLLSATKQHKVDSRNAIDSRNAKNTAIHEVDGAGNLNREETKEVLGLANKILKELEALVDTNVYETAVNDKNDYGFYSFQVRKK